MKGSGAVTGTPPPSLVEGFRKTWSQQEPLKFEKKGEEGGVRKNLLVSAEIPVNA